MNVHLIQHKKITMVEPTVRCLATDELTKIAEEWLSDFYMTNQAAVNCITRNLHSCLTKAAQPVKCDVLFLENFYRLGY